MIDLIDKLADGLRSAYLKTSRFVCAHGDIITLASGVALNIASTVLGILWMQKDAYKVLTTDDELASKKKAKVHVAIAAGLGLAGNGLCICSHLISQNRIDTLAKVLATSTNALPLAAVAAKNGNSEEALVAEDNFSIPFKDIGFLASDFDDYGKLKDFESNLFRIRNYAGREGYPCAWNDLKRAISNDKKFEPWGWNIGWNDTSDIDFVLLDEDGSVLESDRAKLLIARDGGEGIRVLFTNMVDLNNGIKFKLRGDAG